MRRNLRALCSNRRQVLNRSIRRNHRSFNNLRPDHKLKPCNNLMQVCNRSMRRNHKLANSL
jgi:hypothetical protein